MIGEEVVEEKRSAAAGLEAAAVREEERRSAAADLEAAAVREEEEGGVDVEVEVKRLC